MFHVRHSQSVCCCAPSPPPPAAAAAVHVGRFILVVSAFVAVTVAMAIAFTMPLDCRVNRFSVSTAQSSTGAFKSMIKTGSRRAGAANHCQFRSPTMPEISRFSDRGQHRQGLIKSSMLCHEGPSHMPCRMPHATSAFLIQPCRMQLLPHVNREPKG